MAHDWSIGQVRSLDVERSAERVARGLNALTNRQHPDGSWGSPHPLDKVVATCHAVMAFLAAGRPANDPTVARGLSFLSTGYVDSFQWGFWRVGPMVGIPSYLSVVERDLIEIENRIATHAGGPSVDQPLTTFLARLYQRMGDPARAEPHLRSLLGSYRVEEAWLGRAAATSHALSVLLNSNLSGDVSDEMKDRSVELIAFQASRESRGLISWEARVTSTSYIAMNIVENERMSSDPRLRPLLDGAKGYLLAKQSADGLWPVESPPYGGDLEITEPDYYSAVALRGLIALCWHFNPDFLTGVGYALNLDLAARHKEREAVAARELERVSSAADSARKAASIWRVATFLIFAVVAFQAAVTGVPRLASALGLVGSPYSDALLSRYGSWASLIALAITLGAFLASRIRRQKS